MSVDVEYIDEIPEGEGPYERGLWAEARWWVAQLLLVFGDVTGIARIGLTRRLALICRNWLWSIEGMARRLIIAAALALDPSKLTPVAKPKRRPVTSSVQPAQDQKEQGAKRKPSAAFRIFSIHRWRPPLLVVNWDMMMAWKPRPKRKARGPLPLHRHLSFPADDLLLIGVADLHRKHKPGLRRRSPLDRRGRISRWDPDYRGRSEEEELASYNRHFFGPFPERILPIDRPPEDKPAPRPRDIHDPYRIGSAFEFRRIEDEWTRVIPAPDLAGRIAALARVMEKPECFIERLARQLHASADLTRKLLATPEPKLEKPKRDPTPIPPGLDLLARIHAALPRLDSS